MELYIQVSFWMAAVGIVLRMIIVANASYPRTTETSLGSDLIQVITTIGFAFWAGSLIF